MILTLLSLWHTLMHCKKVFYKLPNLWLSLLTNYKIGKTFIHNSAELTTE